MINTEQIQNALDIAAERLKDFTNDARTAEDLGKVMNAAIDVVEAQQALNDYLALQNLNVVP